MFGFYSHTQSSALGNLFPLFNHSIEDLFKAAKSSCIIYISFDTLLIYFPFLKSPEKTSKWAHFALLFTTLKYVVIIVITILYFSLGQLQHTLWPTLTMAKIIEFSFMERFEYLFIFMWLIVIIPSICIPLWCCTRILKKVTTIKPSLSLAFFLVTLYIIALTFHERVKIDSYQRFVSNLGFYFIFAYIPLLFIIYLVIMKFKKTNLA
ncbi:GerAB/ArcD/ProY family transporter [Paenibacillus psychroresistens]